MISKMLGSRVNLKVKPVTTYYHSMQKSFVCIISDGYLNKQRNYILRPDYNYNKSIKL